MGVTRSPRRRDRKERSFSDGGLEKGSDRLRSSRRKMKSGFAVIEDTQFLPGYCLLLAYPRVESLNRPSMERRRDFLFDMSLIGDAVEQVLRPKRINYSIYGNKDPFLHAHIFPRYDWEPEELKPYPVWRYPEEKWKDR